MNTQEVLEPLPKRTKRCGHCHRDLSSESYRVHYQRFYDTAAHTWRQDVQDTPLFVPTLLREKAYEASSEVVPQSECLPGADMEDQSEINFDTCDSGSENEDKDDEVSTAQDDTPDVFIQSDDEQDSSADESSPHNAAQDNSLPYELERILRAYTLFILFLQFQYTLSNSCINSLLKATHTFLDKLVTASTNEKALSTLAATFPRSLYRLKSWLHVPEATFQEYALCPTCGWTYKGETCKASRDTPFLCTNTQFPNHPQQSRIQQCQTPLTKVVRTSDGETHANLLQTLCYNPIAAQLANLLCRFDTELNRIPTEEVGGANLLFDIEDSPKHRSRLALLHTRDDSKELNLVLNVNIDWFQPYKHVQHSVGAIYASLNNLPRQHRYQMQNVLLIAVIPGPKEPVQMNSILGLVVDELKDLQVGVNIDGTIVKAALECMACDIPAARKSSGFSSHSSTYGCTRCLKTFPHSAVMNKVDSSGYDIDNWEPRNDRDVISTGIRYQMARSKAEKKQIVKQTGVKYSPLQTLDYFSPVQDVIIDPMHNLFLGVAKSTLHTWRDSNLLSDRNCQYLQSKVNSVIVPRDVGRIPSKLASSFASMTADEWRLWTTLYSPISLIAVLPQEHRNCWDLFVRACTVFCSKAISGPLCDYGKECMVSFCHQFQQLYGNAACVPNMHFSCHLDEYLREHGPAYGFWLFPFERMNGLLGDTHTNKHAITLQFMRQFIRKCSIWQMLHTLPADLSEAFFPPESTEAKKTSGGVRHTCDVVATTRAQLPLQLGNTQGNLLDKINSASIPQAIVGPSHTYLPTSAIQHIHQLISLISSKVADSIHIERSSQTATKCICGDTIYKASSARRGHDIYGRGWENGGRQLQTSAGQVQQFLNVHFTIEGKPACLFLAEISWYAFTGNATIPFPWQEVEQPRTGTRTLLPFIPVACILSRAARTTHLHHDVIAPVDFLVHDNILRHLM